jgi:cyclophilin family peptidyl-prolyl cis-trans isomerase/HEAT repeat protein
MRPRLAAATVFFCAWGLSASSQITTQRREPEITETALGAAVLAAEDARAPANTQVAVLLEGAKSPLESLKRASIRALGRIEQRAAIPNLLPFLSADDYRQDAAFAIAQAMRGAPLQVDTGWMQVEGMLTALSAAIGSEKRPEATAVLSHSIARLPFVRADQVERAEQLLAGALGLSKAMGVRISNDADAAIVVAGAARALEMLPRLHRTLYRPNDRTTDLLRATASGLRPGITGEARAWAFYALMTGGGVDADTLRRSLTVRDPQVRRAAMSVVGGAGSPIQDEERVEAIRAGLADPEYFVRFEAVRAYARVQARGDGCLPLSQMLNDASEHVVLAAIDALGESCGDDTESLEFLLAQASTPPNAGSWRREAHALVALARRSPEHAAAPMASHSRHVVWQVRMYAARAAGIAEDMTTLERLAYDVNDNVRDATLGPLRRLKPDGAEPAFLAALHRDDYQLLRTAARELAGVPATRSLGDALVDAVIRITAQKRETSRDTRLAILERLRTFGSDRHVERLRPLLRDFDPKVAEAAAATFTAWTGQTYPIVPQPLPGPPLPAAAELQMVRTWTCYLVMEDGREIPIDLDVTNAPLTTVRFLRLANANYYDGLTFHRVVPNFVIQGGSPGANEYMGDGPFMRDEISTRTHGRGTIGISTRGRDTGDAQIFVNLVPNHRLDFEYTVFGSIGTGAMDAVDQIGEGDRIKDVIFRRRVR